MAWVATVAEDNSKIEPGNGDTYSNLGEINIYIKTLENCEQLKTDKTNSHSDENEYDNILVNNSNYIKISLFINSNIRKIFGILFCALLFGAGLFGCVYHGISNSTAYDSNENRSSLAIYKNITLFGNVSNYTTSANVESYALGKRNLSNQGIYKKKDSNI